MYRPLAKEPAASDWQLARVKIASAAQGHWHASNQQPVVSWWKWRQLGQLFVEARVRGAAMGTVSKWQEASVGQFGV